MSNDLTTKASNLQDLVRDRIRSVLFESIPNEEIDGFIQREYKAFFEDNRIDQYGRKEVCDSPLKKMVKAEIQAQMEPFLKEEIRKHLDAHRDPKNWQLFTAEFVEAFAPMALKGMMAEITNRSLSAFSESLTRRF